VQERVCGDSKELSERKLNEIEEVARGWGKLLAREAYPEGPGLDVSLADMEDVVAGATGSLVREGSLPDVPRGFFPQRPVLRVDGHGSSPTALHRIPHMAGVVSSFDVAEVALAESLVKQIHKRVKGTEKLFNAGPSGVIARCLCSLSRRSCRMAPTPPRLVEPRTKSNPKW